MNILAVDSSHKDLSLSLKIEDKITTKIHQKDGKHSEIFLEAINDILKKSNIKSSSLSGILFNKGPASFTGTRVAASSLQAIGYSLDIPIIGISSLEVMAYMHIVDSDMNKFKCAKYAYGSKYFTASFEKGDKLRQIKDTLLADIDIINIPRDEHLVINNELSEYLQKNSLHIPSNYTTLSRETNSEDLIFFSEKYINLGDKFNLRDTLPDYANHEI